MKTKTPTDYLKEPYARVLTPEAEGGFSAEMLEFPGCYSDGDTAEEALRNLEDAAFNWLEAALAQGQDIPEPFAKYEASGRVALRLPRGTHQRAIQMAEREHTSLNTFLVGAVEARIGAGNFYDHMVQKIESRLITKTAVNVMARVIPMVKAWDEASFTDLGKRAATGPWAINNVFMEVDNNG